MPIVRVSMATGRSEAQKQTVAREITETLVRHCRVHAEHVYVLFEDVSPDEWIVGGQTITQRKAARGET